jgi:amino acid transporter
MENVERQTLKRAMNFWDVLSLGFGSIIGWGWIMLVGDWIQLAGVGGAIVAFLIGTVLCIFVGLTYAELTPALPLAGGELAFSYRGLGYVPSWITGWMLTFAYISVAAFEGPALASAIDYLVPIPRFGYLWTVAGFDVYVSWAVVGIVGAILLTILNYVGIKSAAIFQTFATGGLAIGGVLFLCGSVINGQASNVSTVFTNPRGLMSVILMVPLMFIGFDVIPQSAEEMNIPLKKIAKILIMSVCLAAAWYIMVIINVSVSAPAEVREKASIAAADSFAFAMGSPIFGKLLILVGLCGILTSWNAFIVGATRVLFAMSRAKMLPAMFGNVHPKYGTPTAAILLVGFLSALSPLLGRRALVWITDAGGFGTVIAYFMVAISFLALRRNEPDLVRPYKVKNGPLVGWIAVAVAAIFLYLYLPIGPAALLPVEWAMVLVWVALGVVLFLVTAVRYRDVKPEETEYLMFGEEYARKKKD